MLRRAMVPNPDYIDLGHIIKEPFYLTFFQISDIINISKERNKKNERSIERE